MSRPATSPKFEGAPCRRCGGTLRYVKPPHVCVECTKRRNEAKYDPINERKKVHQIFARSGRPPSPKVSYALDADARTMDAAARSQRLDNLVRSKLLGSADEAKPPPAICFGDLWRASLPVGAPPPSPDRNRYQKDKPQRQALLAELTAAVATLLPKLPDVVIQADVVERLPDDLADRFGARLPLNLARSLQALGVTRRKTSTGFAKSFYFIRAQMAYDGMSVASVEEHMAARTYTRPGDALPVGEKRRHGRPNKLPTSPAIIQTLPERPPMTADERRQFVAQLYRQKAEVRAAKNARNRAAYHAMPFEERRALNSRRRARRAALRRAARAAIALTLPGMAGATVAAPTATTAPANGH